MSESISIDLIRKYLANKCSVEEIAEVHEWFSSYQHAPNQLTELSPAEKEGLEHILFERITQQIQNTSEFPANELNGNESDFLPHRRQGARIYILKRIMAAAILIVCLGIAFYISRTKIPEQQFVKVVKVTDLPPGGNKALLTLGNGTNIVLDSVHNGTLAMQGNIKINKTRNGQLVYSISNKQENNTARAAKMNMISTPVGGQYQVILPDGTQAWLNSKSSLRFPDFFQGDERRVEVTGEVYFEVAKNPHMPFKVKSKNAEVEVLGTHFDIMAYDDEVTQKTTLLEGSVKITTNQAMDFLRPGQQAVINKSGLLAVKSGVEIENVMAWKNGYFDFKDMDLATVMRQAARWYDIEVSYKGETSATLYTGKISKEVNLSELLNMLQYTGLKYKMDGKNITVLP